jgi:hypothetical protein
VDSQAVRGCAFYSALYSFWGVEGRGSMGKFGDVNKNSEGIKKASVLGE